MKWICSVCGYEHEGDRPPDECPICGAGPDDFEPADDANPFAVQSSSISLPTMPSLRCGVCDGSLDGTQGARCTSCGARFACLSAASTPMASPSVGRRSYVVVGGGVAGWSAVERIRALDSSAAVTLVTNEPCVPYYRLSLTRLLGGETDSAALFPHSLGWYNDHHIDVQLETDVLEVDRARHEVRTNRGVVRYDRLVACTGARPFLPPLRNGWLRGVTGLRTLLDARSLLDQTKPGVRVVVVGAGVLGLETAFALRSRGCEVTVCEGASQLLGRQLDADSAAILQAHLETKGIRFVLGDLPVELIGDDKVRALRTTSGTSLAADVVVLSAGVRPNTLVWAQSGLHVERGVVVDHALRTSDPDILAAGDVVEHGGVVYGIWPAAQEMGKVAGVNAAGGSGTFSGIPISHSLKVVDLDVFSIGTTRAQGEGMRAIAATLAPPRVEKIIVLDGAVVGGILMGDTSLSVRLRSWVQEHRDVTGMLGESESADILFQRLRSEG